MKEETKIVFISYCWGNLEYEEFILEFAEVLLEEGFEVILDKWELKVGHDMDYFMERSIRKADKVLIMCDKTYKEKANDRIGGVGKETSLITPNVYNNTKQEKFIPVFTEKVDGTLFVPDFLASRLGIDMTERKVRHKIEEVVNSINGRSMRTKPQVLDKQQKEISFENINNIRYKGNLDSLQMTRVSEKYFISKSLTKNQIIMVRNFLNRKNDEDDNKVFLNFVTKKNINEHYTYNKIGELDKRKNEKEMFDLYSLHFLVIAEICGYNMNSILFDESEKKSINKVHPNRVIISKSIFHSIEKQLISLIREFEANIPIFASSFRMLNNGPRIIDDTNFVEFVNDSIEELSNNRFVSDGINIIDNQTNSNYFARVIFDIFGGEFKEELYSVEERKQMIFELGGEEVCVEILQKAFEAQGKPYNASDVVNILVSNLDNGKIKQ